MLAVLVKEAGWTDDDFLQALVNDVTRKALLAKTTGETHLLQKLA